MKIVIAGRLVLLRKVLKTDLQDFWRWLNNTEITRCLTAQSPITFDEEKKWFEDLKKNEIAINPEERNYVFTIIAKSGSRKGKPIGNCGLHEIRTHDSNGFFGIMIGEKEYWGNGFGTEVATLLFDYGFHTLKLHRISSSILDMPNNWGKRLHEKLGFKSEGRILEARFKEDQWIDEIMYGLFPEDWEHNKIKAGVI